MPVFSLFPSSFVKAPPYYTSALGPSPTPSSDLSLPRLQGSFNSLMYQARGLSHREGEISLQTRC